MDSENIAKLKEEIERLKKTKEELFRLGWQNENKAYTVAGIIFFFVGAFGVGDLLTHGLTWYNSIALVAAFAAYKKATSMERSALYCRDEFRRAAAKLEALESDYSEATFVPETPEESERKWREMMIELEQQTKPHS